MIRSFLCGSAVSVAVDRSPPRAAAARPQPRRRRLAGAGRVRSGGRAETCGRSTISLLEPIEGAMAGHIDTFRWSPVAGADGYVIKIVAVTGDRVVWESQPMAATETKLPATVALEPEVHTWSVFGAQGRRGVGDIAHAKIHDHSVDPEADATDQDFMTKDLLKGLNEHLKLEFRASHEYLAMSIWLSEHDLPGFATWMRKQSSDELLHAQRIIDHLIERDQKVVLPAIAAPPLTWKSAEALCDHVLKNEREVTASINELYAMAEKAKDRPGVIMLQWFVTEQMEEEAAARAVLGRIQLAGNTGVGLLMIDQELAAGSVPGMPASPTDAGA